MFKFADVLVIEGHDQSGKQTQVEKLYKDLKQRNIVLKFEVPFKDYSTHKLIYLMLKSGHAKTHPNIFQLVQFLNKFIFQFAVLFPSMIFCDFIILDRWSLSSLIYGDASGVSKEFNKFLQKFLYQPNKTIIIYGNTYKRSSIQDVYEKDDKFQSDVKTAYFLWGITHKDSCRLVSNEASIDTVYSRVLEAFILLTYTIT